MFIYPIYNHNWRNISTTYIHITRLASNEIFSSPNKTHREVGRAYQHPSTISLCGMITCTNSTVEHKSILQHILQQKEHFMECDLKQYWQELSPTVGTLLHWIQECDNHMWGNLNGSTNKGCPNGSILLPSLQRNGIWTLGTRKDSYAAENIHTPVCLHGMHRDNFIIVFNGLHLYVGPR
jgi:hypothetical protein